MKKIIYLMLFILGFVSCSNEVYMDTPTKDWREHTEAVATFETPPHDDKYCKSTLRRINWNYNVSSLGYKVVTPVGDAKEHGWYMYYFKYSINTTQNDYVMVECRTEAEWKNYWDQHFLYDNELFDCSYYVPYPFPEGDSHSNYNGPNNCLRDYY